jgi:hypothetical protein
MSFWPWRRGLDAPDHDPHALSRKTVDNTLTETPEYGSRNSFETRTQRAVTTPISEKPVIPPLPVRSSSAIIPKPGVSGTVQGGTPASVASAAGTGLPPLTNPPYYTGAGQMQGRFTTSSSVTPNVQRVPAIPGEQGRIVDNTHSDRTPFGNQVTEDSSIEVDCRVR